MTKLLSIFILLAALAPRPAAAQAAAGVTVGGRVIRPAAVPAAAIARVVLTDASTGLAVGETAVNAEGSFRFSSIRPGIYRVQIPQTAADWVSDPVTFAAADRDVAGIELVVNALVQVTWTVAVGGGGLRPPVNVSLVQYRGGQVLRSFALTEAVTSRPIQEGQYRISWSPLPAGYELKAITAGPIDVLSNPLKIDAAGAPPHVTITLGVSEPPPWVKVSGRVSGLYSSPLPKGLHVVLEDPGTLRRTVEAPVDADGAFEFAMVLPGSYRPQLTGGTPVQVMSPPSVVVPNANLTGVQIAFAARKEVKGKVTIEGPPPAEPPSSIVVATNSGQSAVRIQSDGSFTVTLPVGNASIFVAVQGYTVRALTYGASNLLRETLRIGLTDAAELRVTIAPPVAAPAPASPPNPFTTPLPQ